MILKVKPDGRQLLNDLDNIMKRMVIPLRLKPGENFKIFVVKTDKLLIIMLCAMKIIVQMRQFKMDLGEHVHELNFLCGAKAMFTSHRIGFCSVS